MSEERKIIMLKRKTARLLVIAALACVAVLTTGCGNGKGISIFKPNVSLNDYITINPLGYNGAGRVEVIFDYEQLAKDYENKIKKNPPIKYSNGKEGVEAASYVFSYYFPYRLVPEKNEGFVNGDVVNLSWALSDPGLEALENVLNLNYRYEDVQYTMEGLEEGRVVDIFEKMNVDYSGLDGEGTVSFLYNREIFPVLLGTETAK